MEQRAWTCTHSRLQGRASVSPPSDLVPERTNRGLELCPCWVERSSMLRNIKVDHMKGMGCEPTVEQLNVKEAYRKVTIFITAIDLRCEH